MQKLKVFQPFLLLFSTLILLSILSYIPEGIKVGPFETKKVDFIEDIKSDPISDDSHNIKEVYKTNSASIFGIFTTSVKDAIPSEFTINKINELASYNTETSPQTKEVPISGNTAQLKKIVTALKNSKNQKVRIAYWGDSAIEGDNITADFREALQSMFGGIGVGFQSITSQDANFRASIKMTFSSDWNSQSVTSGTPKNPVGITGSVFIPKSGSWAEYETTWKYKTVRSFTTARVFYGDVTKASSINYSFDGGASQTGNLVTGSGVKELTLTSSKEAKKFKFSATQNDQGLFFGVSLEQGNGVYVDNFPLRGDDGRGILRISQDQLKGFQKIQNYDLLIIHFGLNVLDKVKDFGWYEKEMIKVVDHLKAAFPNTSILIVGLGDRSQKKGNKFVTHANLIPCIDALKNVASKTNVAFWNLFEAMGGENSMDTWVNASPQLAAKDYTHYTAEGSKKVAQLLSDALINFYKKN
ncbi:MAG: hypothetical protein IAE91_12355 [Ignavibacteriaceae bacterium]|nr:hypothetical protein [Ignavibacteriaceae bacterium]